MTPALAATLNSLSITPVLRQRTGKVACGKYALIKKITMAAAFPYTHYACPCSDLTSAAPSSISSKRASTSQAPNADADEDRTFNPHDPRANYCLYPLDSLLFCDECEAIRCPKCWTEESINWYCPACLFEVPSSAVKSDGNR